MPALCTPLQLSTLQPQSCYCVSLLLACCVPCCASCAHNSMLCQQCLVPKLLSGCLSAVMSPGGYGDFDDKDSANFFKKKPAEEQSRTEQPPEPKLTT